MAQQGNFHDLIFQPSESRCPACMRFGNSEVTVGLRGVKAQQGPDPLLGLAFRKRVFGVTLVADRWGLGDVSKPASVGSGGEAVRDSESARSGSVSSPAQ